MIKKQYHLIAFILFFFDATYGQILQPFFTLKEAQSFVKIYKLYSAAKYDSVLIYINETEKNASILNEDYRIYLMQFYSLSINQKTNKELLFQSVNRCINTGLKLSDGFDLNDFLVFDNIKNKQIEERLLPTKESKIDSALVNSIRELFESDQSIRAPSEGYLDSLKIIGKNDSFMKEFVRTDSINTVKAKVLIHKFGWPGISVLGKDVDEQLWTVIQHSDRDISFQIYLLELIRASLLQGNTRPANFAYLYDRICINLHRPQLYGTQFVEAVYNKDYSVKEMKLQPLDDSTNVNIYRKAMGMPTIEKYIEETKAHFTSRNRK